MPPVLNFRDFRKIHQRLYIDPREAKPSGLCSSEMILRSRDSIHFAQPFHNGEGSEISILRQCVQAADTA